MLNHRLLRSQENKARRQGAGLADAEVALAARSIRAGLPCLRLTEIAPPPDARATRGTAGPVDLYDSFADMFTVLQVSTVVGTAGVLPCMSSRVLIVKWVEPRACICETPRLFDLGRPHGCRCKRQNMQGYWLLYTASPQALLAAPCGYA